MLHTVLLWCCLFYLTVFKLYLNVALVCYVIVLFACIFIFCCVVYGVLLPPVCRLYSHFLGKKSE